MSVQYKFEYSNWKDKSADFQNAKSSSRSSENNISRPSSSRPNSRSSSSVSLLPATTGKTAMTQQANGGAEVKSQGGSGRMGGEWVGKKRGGKTPASGLEKVVLPAGYCVYYARGRGMPLLQIDADQGRVLRSNTKSLGAVNPDSHHVIEEEYAIIREVMEMFLEKQVAEGEEGARYRAGGQLEQQKQLLDELMSSLPENEVPMLTLPETLPAHGDDQATQADALTRSSDTSRSMPTARVTGRCLLPISKALKTDASPRGPLVMEGQSVLDAGRDGGGHQPQSKQSRVGSGHVLQAENMQVLHVKDMSEVITDPPEHYVDRQSRNSLRDKHKAGVPVTDLKSRAPPTLGIKQKCQQPQTKNGLINVSVLNTQGQKGPRLNLFRPKDVLSSRPQHIVVPQKHDALLVVSERSPLKHREQDTVRSTAKTSQNTPAQSVQKIVFSGKPVKASFKDMVKGKAARSAHQQWKPVASHLHQARNSRQVGKEDVDGPGSMTNRRPKLVLDVVLPREEKSRESIPRLNNATGTLYRPQHPLQVLVPSLSPPPPPPPPPSAPTNIDDDDFGHFYILNHYKPEESDGEMPYSSSASYSSATSPRSSVEEARCPEDAEPVSTLQAVHSEDGSSSCLVHPHQPSGDSVHATSSSPADLDRDTASNQHPQTRQSLVRRSSQDSAKKSTHSAISPASTSALRQQSGNIHRPQTPGSKALHCDVLGPGLCGHCEAAQHRRHFTAQQEFLYPDINATPRHLVASHKLKEQRASREGTPHRMSTTPSTWTSVPDSQLNNVVTDLELCRRIVEKGHRAKLPSSFS